MLLEAIGTDVGHCRVKAALASTHALLLMNHLAQHEKLLSHKSAVFLQMFAIHCFLIPLLPVLPPALHSFTLPFISILSSEVALIAKILVSGTLIIISFYIQNTVFQDLGSKDFPT